MWIVCVLDATQRCVEKEVKEVSVKGAIPKVNDTDLFHLERVFLRIGGNPTVFLLSLASSMASAIFHTSSISKTLALLNNPVTINMAKQSLRS
jgi:hypothetical protein